MQRAHAFSLVMLCSSLAQAQTPSTAVGGSARAHFTHGLAHAEQGQLETALQEFEAAYALQPHYSVLYNIGQAEAALGRPANAVRAFERYLLEGANRLSEQRRDEVRALLATNRARLGELRVVVHDATTRVWLDGVELNHGLLTKPLSVAIGKHSLLFSNGGGAPRARQVTVDPTGTTEVRLEPTPPAAPTSAATLLRVTCELPGFEVYVDATKAGVTPLLEPLVVPAGPKAVRLSRPGYLQTTRRVFTTVTGPVVVSCEPRPEPILDPSVRATLVVHATPSDAEVFVDGQRFLGAALPFGAHKVRVQRDGFVPSQKYISLPVQQVTNYAVQLRATEAHRLREKAEASRRNALGFASAGAGLAFALGGLSVFVWNNGRYRDWRDHRASESQGSQLQTVASLQRADDVAFGCLALGTGLLATGGWLLLTQPARPD